MPMPGGRHPSACGISPTYEIPTLDYEDAPFLVIWEVTQACDLACVHCRASARPMRDVRELSREEARRVFGEIRGMGTRLLVLTGGDPLKRADIFDLIRDARAVGLKPALSPSATPLLTAEGLEKGREAGLSAVSLSLDGATAETHDRFRGIPGAYARTMEAAAQIRAAKLELRLNTTVTSINVGELESIAREAGRMDAKVWSVFFLVPTGRASESMQISPTQCEEVLSWLYRLSATAPFRIKTTEAPHYRRVVLETMAQEAGVDMNELLERTRSGGGRFMPGMNDARGFAFISHVGDLFPSGFFPLSAGNVRNTSMAELYRNSALFRALRDPDKLTGRCGACEYRSVCGGSRARAWAATGDPFGEDPLCAYPGASAR